MDGQRFDVLTRSLARRASRRSVLAAVAGGIALLRGRNAAAQETCPPGTVACGPGICHSPCPQGLDCCNGSCVNAAFDTGNCGGCGHRCVSGQGCLNGACVCPPGTQSCADGCFDPAAFANDFNHCGGCDVRCGEGQECRAGRCSAVGSPDLCPDRRPPCAAGLCCAEGEHCNLGACCPAERFCHVGIGLSLEDFVCCPSDEHCVQNFKSTLGEPRGKCCPERFVEACDGICSDYQTDPRHCGSCYISCGADQNCRAGQCVDACPPQNPEACPGPNGSVTCHSACPAGTQCCTGSCLSACPGGQRRDPDRGCGCVAV